MVTSSESCNTGYVVQSIFDDSEGFEKGSFSRHFHWSKLEMRGSVAITAESFLSFAAALVMVENKLCILFILYHIRIWHYVSLTILILWTYLNFSI